MLIGDEEAKKLGFYLFRKSRRVSLMTKKQTRKNKSTATVFNCLGRQTYEPFLFFRQRFCFVHITCSSSKFKYHLGNSSRHGEPRQEANAVDESRDVKCQCVSNPNVCTDSLPFVPNCFNPFSSLYSYNGKGIQLELPSQRLPYCIVSNGA